jgi:Cof subfamily protein (haloacid dehalogenase superfamily)
MKLFVTDIDDTLSVGEIVSREVRDACARLRERGWEIMIATGRIFGASKAHVEAVGATQPSIFYDGARLMTPEGKDLRSLPLSISEDLLDFLWTLPVEIQIVGDEVVRCRESDLATIRFYRKSGVPVDFIVAPSAKGAMPKGAMLPGPIYRVGLWMKAENLPAVEEKVRDACVKDACVEVVSSGPNFLDILPKGVSKGAALKEFVANLPQRPEVIVAAGDHKNDLTMLNYADVAVAPRNASEDALSLAHIVMPAAAESGVSALAEYLLSSDFSVPRTREGPPLIL